jgi:hypothetical protein
LTRYLIQRRASFQLRSSMRDSELRHGYDRHWVSSSRFSSHDRVDSTCFTFILALPLIGKCSAQLLSPVGERDRAVVLSLLSGPSLGKVIV